MKTKIFAIFLIAVLLCTAVGCAAPSVNGTEDPTAKTTENADAVNGTTDQTPAVGDETPVKQSSGLLGSSSSITTATVSGGMYLHLVGKVQGEIHGECRDGGDKKDTVALVDFSDGVTVPTDDSSGFPLGRRKYEAVTFVHRLDCTSPCLRKALASGEQFDLTVDFYRTKSDGTEEKYYSIIYENAIFVSMEIFTKERNTHFEEVSFTFSKVTYTFHDGNVSFSDTWN